MAALSFLEPAKKASMVAMRLLNRRSDAVCWAMMREWNCWSWADTPDVTLAVISRRIRSVEVIVET